MSIDILIILYFMYIYKKKKGSHKKRNISGKSKLHRIIAWCSSSSSN